MLFLSRSSAAVRLAGRAGCRPYLVGVEAVEPALDVRGVPARHQAAVLQGPELGSGLGPGRDHLVEGVLQGHRVVVGSLVLSNTSKAGLFPEQTPAGHNPWAAHEALQLTPLELPAQLGAKNQGSWSQPRSRTEPGGGSSQPSGSSPGTRSRLDLQG